MIELHPDLELTTAEAERVLEAWLSDPVQCRGIQRLKGGLVNSVFSLEFNRPPHRAVIKVHGGGSDSFAGETRALDYLRTETSCPVPEVYLHDSSARLIPHAFLLLEQVPGVCLDGLELDQAQRSSLDAQLADVLLDLHSHTGSSWGAVDATDEPDSWADVFGVQLAEARSYPDVEKRLSPDVVAGVDAAIALARPALHDAGTPTLVHGDVWDGNLMVDQVDGQWRLSGLLDPDLQFADVELELAYLEVFDNRRDTFFDSYTERRPLREGYEQRRLFYWLRTALLHVGLFEEEFFGQFTARTVQQIHRLDTW